MAGVKKSNLWMCSFIILLYFTIVSASSSHRKTGPENLVRLKRQKCVDGFYDHEDQRCCKCARGEKLVQHCTADKDRICDHCETGTYNSEPNNLKTCQPCTSCEHPNANLEVEEPCTRLRDATCRCKKDHYCTSPSKPCILCQPCDTCDLLGIKIPCSADKNAVCNEEKVSGGIGGIVAGIVVPLVLIFLISAVCWKKRELIRRRFCAENATSEKKDEEHPMLNVPKVSLEPHLSEIADILGWKLVRQIARQSKIPESTIESCEDSHRHDNKESTFQLMKAWSEMKGSSGSVELIEMLKKSGKRDQAEKILNLLKSDSNNESSP